MKVKGTAVLRGDFGNPAGTGIVKMFLHGLEDAGHEDVAAVHSAVEAFVTGIKSAGFTGCNLATKHALYDAEGFADKPGASVNIDRKVLVTWRTKTSSDIHQMTIPGLPSDTTLTEGKDAGERLKDSSKASLGALIETLYGVSAGNVVVIEGVVLQPR